MSAETITISREKKFIDYILGRIGSDTGFGAVLRRADNPATEYMCWEHLAHWCDLEKDWERLPFAIIGAALANLKPERDGILGIGKAIAKSYAEDGRDNGNEKDAAKLKLRRLLSCKTTSEACKILRPTLRLIASRGVVIDHAKLLNELLYFNKQTTARWAQDFYGRKAWE